MCVYCEIHTKAAFYNEHPELNKNGDVVRLQINVIGDAGCGKTAFIGACGAENFLSTISVSRYARYKLMKVNDKPAEIIFYDMIGLEDYSDPRTRSLMLMFSEVIILCYSVNSPESFSNVSRQWFPELQASRTTKPVILVGLKKDLRHDQSDVVSEYVTFKEGKALASSIGAVGFMECSSLTQEGVKDVFEMAVKKTLNESTEKNVKRVQFWRHLCCFT